MNIIYLCVLLPLLQVSSSLSEEETDLNSLSSNYDGIDEIGENVENFQSDSGVVIFDSISPQLLEEICKNSNTLVYISEEDITIDCEAFNKADKPIEHVDIVKRSADLEEGSGDVQEPETHALEEEITTPPPKQEETEGELTTVVPKQEETQDEITTIPPKEQETEDELTTVVPKQEETQDEITTIAPKEEETEDELTTVVPKQEETQDEMTTIAPKEEERVDEVTTVQKEEAPAITTEPPPPATEEKEDEVVVTTTRPANEGPKEETVEKLDEENNIPPVEKPEDVKNDTEGLKGRSVLNSLKNVENKDAGPAHDDSARTKESTENTQKAGNKDTTILIVLFAAVVIVGALAFGYNYVKKRRQQSSELERVERGSIKRSFQNLTKQENGEPERKPLIGDNKEVEMVNMKKEPEVENVNEQVAKT